MGQDTAIQWAKHSWNPWRGCSKVSPGCTNCYAETWSKRNPKIFGTWGEHGTRVVAAESAWRDPVKWDREAREAGERHRVFCASMADVFEDWRGLIRDSKGDVVGADCVGNSWMPYKPRETMHANYQPLTMDDARIRLWDLMLYATNLDFLLLTKRPENILPTLERMRRVRKERGLVDDCLGAWINGTHPPDNVWIGTTVENQEQADLRIPQLLNVPAKVRFLSMEPQLEEIDLSQHFGSLKERKIPGQAIYAPPLIHWVIQGGESGSHQNARSFDASWAWKTRDQCRDARVAYFLKQMGRCVIDSGRHRDGTFSDMWPEATERTFFEGDDTYLVYIKDLHGGNPSEWPEDLRVREIPEVAI